MLLSRVAEHLYWAARYLERAEDTARVVAEHTHLLVDLPTSVPLTWEPLLAVTGSRGSLRRAHTAARRAQHHHVPAGRPGQPLAACCRRSWPARENLRTTREVLPARPGRRSTTCTCTPPATTPRRSTAAAGAGSSTRSIGECQRFVGIVPAP